MLERISVPRRSMDFEDYVDILRRNFRWVLAPTFASQFDHAAASADIWRAASRGGVILHKLIAYMVDRMRKGLPLEDWSSLEANIGVVEVFEAARQSARTGHAIDLPLR